MIYSADYDNGNDGLTSCNNDSDDNDVEDSTGCRISQSQTEASSGEKSLFVENRTAKWAGPVAGSDHLHLHASC